MNEFLPQPDPEREREAALWRLIEEYFSEDTDFLADMDEEGQLGYIYGQLFEMGKDPDKVLQKFGVTEEKQ